MAKHFDGDRDNEIERLFSSCDKNGDGSIDIKEIAKVMTVLNNNNTPSEHEGNKIFAFFY
jgi:Ca2+-binding EF-hand superfamily protein